MCGVAGIVFAGEQRTTSDQLRALSTSLAHRGPDDTGYLGWSPGGAPTLSRDPAEAAGRRLGFMHRRLSILDLSTLGWQPMSTPDGRYHAVYNGEIYNFVELREELRALGWSFRSHGDTEVAIAAFAQWGGAALRRFEGMFALAILDSVEGTLHLARDPFGIKPLFYVDAPRGFAFASEVQALLGLGLAPRTADPAAVFQYLARGEVAWPDRTFFAHVRSVPPGHWMSVRVGPSGLDVGAPAAYWALRREEARGLGFDEAAALVRDAFLGSVARHLRSDVPVGVALSGGIDSSAIATAIRRIEPASEMHAFSFIAADERISEEKWIRVAGAAAGATIHEVRPDPSTTPDELDRLVALQGEPMPSMSMYAQYHVFGTAAERGVRVMLDGQGADELMAGYGVYFAPHVAAMFRQARFLAARRALYSAAGATRDVDVRYVQRYVAASLAPRWVKALGSRRARAGTLPEWLRGDWFADRCGDGADMFPADPGPDLFAHLGSSVGTSLLGLLRFEDRNSMAHSVESRVPFLTPDFASLLFSLPAEFLIDRDGTRKAVFRQAMRGIVPDAILDRRDKIGFQPPQEAWLGELRPWTSGALAGETARALPFIDQGALRRSAEAIAAGGAAPGGVPLWRWVNLVRWAELMDARFE
ncbi:asparagine synthase (glutamine-hydrolyzing) [Roseisolibacter sp. H3M3-2]|uniref:asparagine synthase (glutamine-hydrolyzing) n=1 Tax=Roseisolibacter sp. H3M3-2 TaxID=3031323 RepID=UPI0023DCD69E|nr:asparagine synthase (glutamine-hydrolyzing) [Roseisolibacter sp. H3M3-2]MDF1502506.1 asparagine synthase (glutamine-hydrolyzing) [Roseisolibacter sp. H3M3-2]